jgi:outer membrane protein
LWLDARRTQAALAASEAALRAAQASLAAVRAREQLGSATAVESLAAASAQAQAQRELIAAEQARLKASGLLAQRLGWPAATPVVLAGDDGAVLPAATLEESRLSLEQHPQLLAQQARVQALQEALQATRSEGGGSLSLTGQLGPSSSRSNTLTQQYRSIHSVDASVGLTWSMPLSDGGSRQATIARAQAQLDAAHANQDSTRRSLQDNLWRALSDWRSASADSSASGVALQAATASEAAQRGRYGAGVGTVADLLQAQSELAQRRQQLLAAQQQQQRAWAAVLHAAGQTPLQASTLSP